MKKEIVILCILLLSQVQDSPLTVVCTTTALQTLVEEVGKEKVDVISLVQPGVCPAQFDVRPSHVQEMGNASLVLYHGVEPWLEDLITASQNEDVEKVLLGGPWNTPDLAIKKIELIQNALSKVDPENALYYKTNADEAVDTIEALADSIQKEAELLTLDTIPVLCMDWLKSFVEWMGFTVAGSYPPPDTLSLKDVNDLLTTGRTYKAVIIIDNLQSGTALGGEIAAQIDAYHVVLTNFPNAVPGTETISDMIEYNAHQLLNTVIQYQEEKGRISELESELKKEREKKVLFEVFSVLLLVVCVVELIYLRRK